MPILQSLADNVADLELRAGESVEITGIQYDSRKVQPGDLFVAIKGFKVDGHAFILDALHRGAAAVLAEDPSAITQVPLNFPVVLAGNSRRALAELACEFYHHPSRSLCLVAVTGTNGKTTTARLIASIFQQAGYKAGVLGTLGATILDNGESISLERTTPESLDLQRMLAQFVEREVEAVAMEVSSHALMLERVRGCAFDVGVFTNLSQDHLDFHQSLEEYLQAKAGLFTDYAIASSEFKGYGAVINIDDPSGRHLVELCPLPTLTYAVQEAAHLRAEDLDIRASGASFVAVHQNRRTPVQLKITGRFNAYNAMAAFGVAEVLGIDPAFTRKGLESAEPPPGRFEMIAAGQPFSVCVDYAHTPDGLEKVVQTAREITRGRVITLFGCGGDRDPGKRPKMGAIAAALSDVVVVTSDNPRTEDPVEIIKDILAGIPSAFECHVEPDRSKAIEQAISQAQPGDFVLLAGKGHETYQIFKDQTVPFDDREVAREILRARFSEPAPEVS